MVLYLGRDKHGKKRYKWIHGFESEKIAERALTDMLHKRDTGMWTDPTKITVEQYLEKWLEDYCLYRLGPQTYQGYKNIINGHLAPKLGSILLINLQPMHVQSYYSEQLKKGRLDGKGGLSPTTVKQHHAVIHKALRQAVKWQLVPRNIADAVDPPSKGKYEHATLSSEQVLQLLDRVEGTPIYLPVAIAVYTGLRLGEVCGIRWKDVDLSGGALSIRQTIIRTENGLETDEPRKGRSKRVVRMSPDLVEIFRHAKKDQARQRLLMGEHWQDHGLVCCREDGRPVNPSTLSKRFGEAVANIEDFPHVRFHDLRHTHATLLLKAGVHLKKVSERLGHATIVITGDTYSTVTPDMQKEVADKFDELLGKKPS